MVFSKKLKDFLSLGTSQVFSSVLYGIFWLYLASILEKTDYGELGYFMSVAQVTSAISLLGLSNTIVVYEAKKEPIFPASFVLGLVSSVIAVIVTFFLFQNIFLSLLILGLNNFFLITNYINSKKRFYDFSKYVLLRAILTVIAALIFYHIFGLDGIFMGYFLASLVILFEFRFVIKNKIIEFSRLRPKLRFMIFSWTTRLTQVFFNWGDKLVVGTMFGFSILGSFTFATQYMLLLDALPRTIGHYLLPYESEGSSNLKIKIFAIGIACIISAISILVVPYGVNFVLPQFTDAILPIQIMSIVIVPSTISMIKQSEFLGKENSRVVLMGSLIQAGLYFVLIIILGEIYGLLGLAVGFLVSATARTIFNLFVGYNRGNLKNSFEGENN